MWSDDHLASKMLPLYRTWSYQPMFQALLSDSSASAERNCIYFRNSFLGHARASHPLYTLNPFQLCRLFIIFIHSFTQYNWVLRIWQWTKQTTKDSALWRELGGERDSRQFFFFFSFLFRATPAAFGSSQARVWIGAAAAGLCHSHSNARYKPHLWTTSELAAMLGP